MSMRYIKRLDLKVHALRGGIVKSFAEFDEKFPENKYIGIWKNGQPFIAERKRRRK